MLTLLLLSLTAAEPSPEVQLALLGLREGEKPRVEKALGNLDELPLYRAELELDPAKREVLGKVAITWVAKEHATDALYLRVTPNAAAPRAVKLSHATVNGAPIVLEQPEPSLYRVRLEPALQPGVGAVIEFKLTAKVPEAAPDSASLTGAATHTKGDYGAFSSSPELLSLVGIIPGVAPTNALGEVSNGPAGIGDLESYDPAFWLVSVGVPNEWKVISPGHFLGEIPLQGAGRTRFTYAIGPARDFTVFAAKGYEKSEATVGEVVIESHYLGSDAETGKKVLKIAKDTLVELQKRLGPYPYRTLRVVEARLTAGAGGMEFPGLVTIARSLYTGTQDPLSAFGLPGYAKSPLFQAMTQSLKPMLEQTLEFSVAHEVAHQWFAMLVGSDPIEEPIADEPLTQHVALLALEWKHGRGYADELRKMQLKTGYQMHRMSGGKDGVAQRPTRDFESNQEYAAVVYGKAPLYFDEVRKLLGEAAWTKALKTYVEDNRWKTVRADTLTQQVCKANPAKAKTIELLRKHWWEEKHGDADLGTQSDLMQMFGGAGAMDPNALQQGLDPQTMKLLEEAMRALSGQ